MVRRKCLECTQVKISSEPYWNSYCVFFLFRKSILYLYNKNRLDHNIGNTINN